MADIKKQVLDDYVRQLMDEELNLPMPQYGEKDQDVATEAESQDIQE